MIKKYTDQELKDQRPKLEVLKQQKRHPISIILENIRSLYNVGSMFRSSDGALIEKLYLSGYTASPPRKEIEKTALGSVASVPWEHHQDPSGVITELKKKNYSIISLEHTTKSIPYNKVDYNFPVCLILGNEVEGISQNLINQSDFAIDIPMFGIKQSLNVTVAYGIIIYHLIEKYKAELKKKP